MRNKEIDYTAHQKQCGCSDPVGCVEMTRQNRREKKERKAVIGARRLCICYSPQPQVGGSKSGFQMTCTKCGGDLRRSTLDTLENDGLTWPMEGANLPNANYCDCINPDCIYLHKKGDPVERIWRHDLPNNGRGYCRCEDMTCLLVHEVDDTIENTAFQEYVDTSGGAMKITTKGKDRLDELMDQQAGITDDTELLQVECPECHTRDPKMLWPYDALFYKEGANSGEGYLPICDVPLEKLKKLEDTRSWCMNCMEERDVKIFGLGSPKDDNSAKPTTDIPNRVGGLAKLPMDMAHVAYKRDGLWKCACGWQNADAQKANEHDGFNQKHFTSWKKDKYVCEVCAYETVDKDAAFEHDKIGKNGKKGSVTIYSTTCFHPPKQMVKGKENAWGIWVGKKWDCENKFSDFDIVVNLTGESIRKKHSIPIPELAKWESGSEHDFREIVLGWPDRKAVNLATGFWKELVDYVKTNKLKMLMFCMGGHGRTGTALACILVTEFKYHPNKAIKWVRDNYCKETIETQDQINYIYSVAGIKETKADTDSKPRGVPTVQLPLPATTSTAIVKPTNSTTTPSSSDDADTLYGAWAGLKDD